MSIYLDAIWALNFLFDSLLLYLTALILKREVKYWRIFLGGFLGSVIILLSITPLHAYSGHPISKILFSIIMLITAFGYKRFSFLLKGMMTFYLITFLVGGALIGIHYFIHFDLELSTSVVLDSVNGFGDPISWFFVLVGFPIAWHFSRVTIDRVENVKIRYDQIVDVTIHIGEIELNCKGLIDSGNQLYDPVSKTPVMFVSVRDLKDLPQSIMSLANTPDSFFSDYNRELAFEFRNRIRIIPYKVVGQDHQLIMAVKPDSIEFNMKGERFFTKKGLVSFTLQQLSSEDLFQCIIHPEMVTGRKKEKNSEKIS